MKKMLITAALVSAAISSCNTFSEDNGTKPEFQGEKIEVCISAGCPTKVSGIGDLTTKEEQIRSFQVLIFKNGYLETYGTSKNNNMILSCTSGKSNIYAVVNGEDCSDIILESDVADKVFELKHCVRDSMELAFTMVGVEKEVSLPSSDKIVIPVSRLVARVEVAKVSVDFLSKSYENQTLQLDSIYLVRASKGSSFSGEHRSGYLNVSGFAEESARETYLTMEQIDTTIANDSSNQVSRYLYCMPNTAADSTETMLVVSARIADRRLYYPLPLGALSANNAYKIKNILIRRPGSTSPVDPVSFDDVGFSVSIEPWSDVNLPDNNFKI